MPKVGFKFTEETKKQMALNRKGKKNAPRSEIHKKRLSESLKGQRISEATKIKISKGNKGKTAWNKGIPMSEDIKRKISSSLSGKPTWNKGKVGIYSEETINKMSKGRQNKGVGRRVDYVLKICECCHSTYDVYPNNANRNRFCSNSCKHKSNLKGEKHPRWLGGISFEPYCPKFSMRKKEQIRNQYGRKCVLCGVHESDLNRKLDVHHVDYNKLQGCENHQWKLVPLCQQCHAKTNYNRESYNALITAKIDDLNKTMRENLSGVYFGKKK